MKDGGPEGAEVALLRHAVATLAYRGGKAVRDAPPGFESFRAAAGSRSAGEILAHIGDLVDWAISLCAGKHVWRDSPALAWEEGSARFFDGLARLDARLAAAEPAGNAGAEPAGNASAEPLGNAPGKLFQGPIADAFTHVGQISLLRRLAGSPVRGENYFKAPIAAGRVGAGQLDPGFEFD
jgi:hypothetical protein